MKLDKKTIFLFDGIGALMSLLFTGIVLPFFSTRLGLSKEALHFLAVFPLLFSIYSLSCYFFVRATQKWMLTLIIGANSLYCLISGTFILFYSQLSGLGALLLFLEILILLLIVVLEIRILRQNFLPQE